MYRKNGFLAVSPLLVFMGLFLGLSIAWGDFYKVPLMVVFIITSVYALATTRGIPLAERLEIFSKGAGSSNLLLMIWIFVLAGAFAASAKAMGAIEAAVNLTLHFLPSDFVLVGLFVAACFISLSIGTSVGTIAALVPVAVGLADKVGTDTALVVAVVVGGSFFGDNLSFISDTTVVATRTQGCEMKDKFRVNSMIAFPVALLTAFIYYFIGDSVAAPVAQEAVDWVRIIPYLLVLGLAVWGMNVLLVLLVGTVLAGAIGLGVGAFDLSTWFVEMGKGISAMGELIIVSLLAAGLLEVIRYNGGIAYLIEKALARISGKRGAEASIAMLVMATNLCTANNTIAILSVGELARGIAEKYHLDPRKSASILDTFSCCVQGLIPYGAQLLIASGLASISAVSILPYAWYPVLLGLVAAGCIFFRLPRRYS